MNETMGEMVQFKIYTFNNNIKSTKTFFAKLNVTKMSAYNYLEYSSEINLNLGNDKMFHLHRK